MNTQNYNDESNILTLLRKITRIIRREKIRSSHVCGFTPPQLIVLKYVKESDSVTMSDISNEMGLGSSTTSGIIDRLVKQDMLARSRSDSDRRVIYINLTEKAKEMISKIHLNHEVFYQNLFSKLSEGDKEQMTKFLEKLYSVLNETLPDIPKDK